MRYETAMFMDYKRTDCVALIIVSIAMLGCTQGDAPIGDHTKNQNTIVASPQEGPNLIQEHELLDDRDDLDVQLEKARLYVKQNSDNGRAYVIRSMVFAALERNDDRIDDLTAAIPLLSNDAAHQPMLCEAYYARGLTYQTMGNDELAISDFDSVLNLEETYASALQARAYSYLRMSNYDLAMNDSNRALQLTPDDPHAYELRSRIRQAQGDEKGAESDLLKYRELSSE